MQRTTHLRQRVCTDDRTRIFLRVRLSEKLGFEMSTRRGTANASPLHEEEIRRPRSLVVTRWCRHDFDAVRKTIRTLEGRRPPMNGGVAADGVGVAARM